MSTDVNEVQYKDRLMHYCTLLYARMESEAETVENNLVWSGRIIATCDELGIPLGSYQRVVRALRASNCIVQVERGFRGASRSRFVLQEPPTAESFGTALDGDRKSDLTTRPNYDTLRAEVQALQKQLGGISIPDALMEVERRLEEITARLDILTNTK